FSKMSTIPHTAYMSSLAPPLAALSAAGIVMFWRAYRAGGWRGRVLPVAVAAEVAWALYLWRDYGGFLPWARDLLAAAGGGGGGGGRAGPAARPATWAASVLDVTYAGSSFNATAGPAGGTGGLGAGGGIGASATVTLTSAEQRLYDYVSAHRDGASYLMAVGSWEEASPYILATGQEVMPMGGFSGTVPSPTLSAVKDLVRTGQLRFFF